MKDGFWSHITGWLTAIFGGLTAEKWAIILGIGFSAGTFVINWVYKQKELELARRKYSE